MTARFRDHFSARPFSPAAVDELVPAATAIVGVGESAHFVTEFNRLRAELVADLVRRHGVTRLALEVGHDEAPTIRSWWRDSPPGAACPVGPLTTRVYGTFLSELRDRLGAEHAPAILGVDLPNSLTLAVTLDPLAGLLAALEPATAELVGRARALVAPIAGASAASSAIAWTALPLRDRDEATAILARIAARTDALAAGSTDERWQQAAELTRTAVVTDLMLCAMSELFAGSGLDLDTTLRERFVADRLLREAAALPDGERIAYVAHNNHIQKAPVTFAGEVAALPAGQFVARGLGRRYVAVGLSHLDDTVPEMVFPDPHPLGFRVERAPLEALPDDAIESVAAGAGTGPVVVRGEGRAGASIRSQSAIATVPADAFDAVIVVASATTDPLSSG